MAQASFVLLLFIVEIVFNLGDQFSIPLFRLIFRKDLLDDNTSTHEYLDSHFFRNPVGLDIRIVDDRDGGLSFTLQIFDLGYLVSNRF